MSRGGRGFPWVWMLYHALDLGLTYDDFWNMTPRAIMLLQAELGRGSGGGGRRTAGGAVVQGGAMPLSRLPRP